MAVHESGHGVVAWFQEGAAPLLKLTIIPRSKGSLGFAQYLPNEDSLQTESELEDQITSILAGRLSEEVFFGSVTTGAYDDLQKAYKIAHAYISKYGMSSTMGTIYYHENEYGAKQYANEENEAIDKEIKQLIEKCEIKCKELIIKHRHLIEELSELLLEKETIAIKEIVAILGERPFPMKKGFKEYLSES